MAFVSLPRARTGSNFTARLSETLLNAKAAMRQRRMYRKTVDELSALSNRELNDLGLCRSMIADVARNAVYR